MNRTIIQFFRLSESVGRKNNIWKLICVIGLAGAMLLAGNVGTHAATIFSENFESGLASWNSNTGVGTTTAPPSAPPDAPASTLSFVQADGATTRIGRGF